MGENVKTGEILLFNGTNVWYTFADIIRDAVYFEKAGSERI